MAVASYDGTKSKGLYYLLEYTPEDVEQNARKERSPAENVDKVLQERQQATHNLIAAEDILPELTAIAVDPYQRPMTPQLLSLRPWEHICRMSKKICVGWTRTA